MVRFSDFDLVKVLKDNGRVSYSDIAKYFNVTESAVRKRVKKLVEEGVIEKFSVVVNPQSLGFKLKVLMGIDTKPECYIKILEWLKQKEEVIEPYSASEDHMIMFEIGFKDNEDMADYITLLENKEGIIKVCPAVIRERVK